MDSELVQEERDVDLWEFTPHILEANEQIREGDTMRWPQSEGWCSALTFVDMTPKQVISLRAGLHSPVFYRGRHPSMPQPSKVLTGYIAALISLTWSALMLFVGHIL